jgi:type IV secretion system protein VirD4
MTNRSRGHRLLLCALALLGGSLVGTQVLAWQARYAPALGPPLLRLGPFPGGPLVLRQAHALYLPSAGWVWAWRWGRQHPTPFRSAALAAVGTMAVLVWPLRRTAAPGPPPRTGHGTARWATRQDVKAAGLSAPTGIVLGQYRGQVLRYAGHENVLVVGPQRQGKGVGLIVPTLLELPGSVMVTDLRGETWQATAGWRAGFSRTLALQITSPQTARFNPLLEVRLRTPREVADVQTIADILVDPEGAREQRDHWEKTAHALLVAAILHVLYTDAAPSLAAVATLLSHPERTIDETLHLMLTTSHLPAGPHPVIAELTREVLNKSGNEASGVLSTVLTFLALYRDPQIAANTTASDFRLAELLDPQQPVSLYLILPPADDVRVRPFIRLFLNQALRRLTETWDGETRNLTLLLDELPALGRIDFIYKNLAYLGGYGIRAFLAVQNLPQLSQAYGDANLFIEQCKVRVYFAAQGTTTGRDMAAQTGTTTVVTEQRSRRQAGFAAFDGARTVAEQQHARSLLTPGEAMQIPADTAVILVAGHPPLWAQKVRYYRHRRWQARVLPPPPPVGPSPSAQEGGV